MDSAVGNRYDTKLMTIEEADLRIPELRNSLPENSAGPE
jgi:hypothetical protein